MTQDIEAAALDEAVGGFAAFPNRRAVCCR
jgi:hypothetical protein